MSTLPDAADRARIADDLQTDLLVEAGAGSGKTTALTGRMLELVAGGTATVDQVAAVTFTRKAAGELRERFQERLEEEIRRLERAGPAPDLEGETARGERLARVRGALRELDRAFIGTIHSFCARLLRERPLEARLDPGFRELVQEEALQLRARFWDGFVERRTAEDDPGLGRVLQVGLRPHQLRGLFDAMVDHPDVDFDAEDVQAPSPSELARVREELEELVDRYGAELPAEPPPRGWDDVQERVRVLRFMRAVHGWDDPVALLEAVGYVVRRASYRTIRKRWPTNAAAIRAEEAFNAFAASDGVARRLHREWLAHRYPVALSMARAGAREFEAFRLRTGQLDFEDLLMQTAALLRRSPGARAELGARYRRILVDEFQDTDPVQAEVLLLLASEPERPDFPADSSEWARAVPRPGQLFVVGDPKQSIYRFRRADIAVYDQVKRRFQSFGGVLHLTTNFRSTADIAALVNGVFGEGGGFPREATEVQAAFAPMVPFRDAASAVRSGVFVHELQPSADNRAAVAEDDAERVASWIRERVDRGERSPGEFLVLTRQKAALARYARALEARNLPVQVTGAGVGIEEELRELLALLHALADPGDAVGVVTVLTGLFFGLDLEALTDHRLRGGGFDPRRATGAPPGPVREALVRLSGWCDAGRLRPADVLVEGLVAELGLLEATAAGPLGSIRAGALTYLLDQVRAAALAGDTSLRGALDAVALALESTEAEAPLEPGRRESVRVMNLHQAKGLEAEVVLLGDPSGEQDRTPSRHIAREGNRARGWLSVSEQGAGYRSDLLAQPLDWPQREERERRFEEAEQWRLLYVAATRARDELWIAHPGPRGARKSPWLRLEEWVRARGDLPSGELHPLPPPPRARLEETPSSLTERGREVAAERVERGRATYQVTSVTAVAREGGAPWEAPGGGGPGVDGVPEVESEAAAPALDAGAPRGVGWGTAVHGALAAAARSGASVSRLRAVGRALLLENERPVDGAGEPRELESLVEVVASVSRSRLWARAMAASSRLVEAPLALRMEEIPGWETGVGGLHSPPPVVEGVVDLAFREEGGWVLVDFKTDVGDDAAYPRRAAAYRRQLDLYARCWTTLTGDPVRECILFHVRSGREEGWVVERGGGTPKG